MKVTFRRNQLSRFLALLNNHQTAIDATTTALNSQGSATRENQAYLTSFEANINRMKTAFSGLAQSMSNAFLKSGMTIGIDLITNITKGVSKLIDTFGLLPLSAGTLAVVASQFGGTKTAVDNLIPSVVKLAGNLKRVPVVKDLNIGKTLQTTGNAFDKITVSSDKMTRKLSLSGKQFQTINTNLNGTLKASKPLAGVFTGLGGAVKGAMLSFAGTALVTGGIMALSWAVEKLINKWREAKEAQDKIEATNNTMVESYRNSGDSIEVMISQYETLYAKYGEFNSAVSSGRIDPNINVEDYELYASITDQLAEKLPTVVEYTDAEGKAHLRTSDAVRQQLEYAKLLSAERAKLDLMKAEENMAKGADKAKESFKELLEVQKEIAGFEENLSSVADTWGNDEAPLLVKSIKSLFGQYDGANAMDYIFNLDEYKDKQAELAVTEEQQAKKRQEYLIQEIEARNKVQASIADQLTIVKDYGTSYMEAEGHVENLGSTSQALVQDFAQMNSGYLDHVTTMFEGTTDLEERATEQAEELKQRSSDLAEATEQLSDSLSRAYENGLKDLDMSGSLAEDKVVIEEYGQSFEQMVNMIPKSMMTIDESTGQLNSQVTSLIDNFDGLGKIDDGIADKSMTYTEARIALSELGVTGKDADQMIRNFAQASGNAELEASLLATTVDETATAMNDLKTSALETVDALSQILGVNSGNVSALTSYIDGIELSKTTFGDAYESSELYAESLAGLATYYGMSEEAVLNNMESIKLYEEALSAVTYAEDENGNMQMQVAEMSAEAGDLYAQATAKMKENGLSLEQNMQIILGMAPDIESAFQSVADIDFSNMENETSQLATTFLTAKDGSKELEEAMLALGESHPDLYTIRDMFQSFAIQIGEGTADLGDFRSALEGHMSTEEIDAVMQAMELLTGKTYEAGETHKETAGVIANNPLKIEVGTTGTEESKEKIDGVSAKADEVDGKTPTLKVYTDKESAQADLDALINKAIELNGTEAQVRAAVEGADTAGGQIQALATLIEELSNGSQTAEDTLARLGGNVDTSGVLGKVAGVKSSVEGLTDEVTKQVNGIKNTVESLNGIFDNVSLGVDTVSNLKGQLSGLDSAVKSAKDGLLYSVADINTGLSSIGSNGSTAITGLSNTRSAFDSLRSTVNTTGASLTLASSLFTGFRNSVAIVGATAVSTRNSILAYAGSLNVSSANVAMAISRSMSLAQAKRNEATAFMTAKAMISMAGNEYMLLGGKSQQATAKIMSDTSRIVASIMKMTQAYRMNTSNISSSFSTMSAGVSRNTSSMISQHQRQINKIKELARVAKDARSAVSNLGSGLGSAMSAMSSFITRASSTERQANQTTRAVEKLRRANANNGVVGAIRNFVGLSTDRLVEAISGVDVGSSISSLYSTMSGSGSTGSMSANAGGATSIGSTGGTSGTIKPSFYTSASLGFDGKMAFSALATNKRTEEKEDAYSINSYERKYKAIETALAKVNGQMDRLNEASASYRAGLANQIKLENQRLSLVNQELKSEQSRLKSIQSQLKKLPAVGKQSVAQRKKYNELQKDYDDTLGNIASLTKEQQDLTNSAIENTRAQFTSLIDEIVNTYTTAIAKFEASVEDLDFKIELLSYTDPDNVAQEMKLMVQRQAELMKQESAMRNQYNALQSQYNSALKKYGAKDERTLYAKEQAEEAQKALRDTTLDVKKAEKDIKDIRSDVADESIKKLQDYYGNMQSMAKDAIKAEQDALEKAFAEREKLYDAEIDKIESVYDAKMKSMDNADAENAYQEEMAKMNTDRAELQRQIAIASRDTSLVGKKNLVELQTQLTEINKEISDAQKERQKELLKEQLESQKEAEIKAIEDKKKADEEKTNGQVEKLENKATDIEKKFDNIIDNEAYWDKLQNDVTNGKFNGLMTELQKMYTNIGNMNNGVFDGLLSEFSGFSKEAQKEFIEMNEMMLKNMKFSDGTNSLDKLKGVAGVKTSTGNTSQKSLGTPDYLGKWSTYSADNVLVSSGTAPAPPPATPAKKATSTSKAKPASQPKPVIGGTYAVKKDLPAYYTSDDAKARKGRRGTVKKGNYWIYNISKGMINVSNKKGYMGSWINPNDNGGGITTSGSVVKSSLNTGDGAQVASDTSGGGYGTGVGAYGSMSANAGAGTAISALGGTSGILSASNAITQGVMERVSAIAPKVNVGGLNDMMDGLVSITGGDTHNYNLTMPVENFNGTKRERDNVLDKFEKELKKRGQ